MPGQTVKASGAERSTGPPAQRGAMVLTALLGATLLGTLSNNILNVPLREITRAFHAPLASGVLVITSFVLVLAAAMAFTGWVGDRFGRRRTLICALTLMAVAQVGAALAPSLPVLIGLRAVQGLACAAIPPSVMGLLSTTYPSDQRARMMSAWAAANGVGQAVGPPLGGLVADLFGWRSIFWMLAPLALLALLGVARGLPKDSGRASPLHWPGAICLTAGAALTMTAATTLPQHSVPIWVDVALAVAGVLLLALFALVSARAEHPLIRPRLIVESRFLRSAVASFAQMFALATVLVAVPLYITGEMGRTTAVTGLLVFALPATMAVLAPGVGLLSDRTGPRRVLRVGLLVLAGASVGFGFFTDTDARGLAVLVALLIAVGVGVALVQTPSATGATRSPAGQTGSALGLFNMMRFGGSALGTAWVAVVYPHGALLLLFSGAALMLVIAVAATYLGPDPLPYSAGSDRAITPA
ncbi:MAG: MFS transporter [Jatrophihabitantaceae bacterium]